MDDDPRPDPKVVSHVAACLRCRAELARYRKLMHLLHQTRHITPAPPAGLITELLDGLESAARRGMIRSALQRRETGMAAAAGLAGAAGLLVMASLRRSARHAGVAGVRGTGLGRGRFLVLSSFSSPQGQ
ncbi:MAG: anti-sigma factor [Acidimicrobiales bacterium]